MSTLKTNKVESTTTGGDCIVKATNTLGHKNLIINGAMKVNQYGTSSTTSGSRVCDRFRVNWGGADEAFTYSKHALTSSDTGPWAKGFRHSLHVQNGNQTSGAGAADYGGINYRVEAQDVVTSGWDSTSASSYITFSYWVKSSVAQNFYVRVYINDAPQYSYAFETGALSANTWTKITKTIPGNPNIAIVNDNGNGLEFGWQLFRGTDYTGSMSLDTWAADNGALRTPDQTSTWWTTNDATFEITGVQLEVGEVATEFEHRSYADELRRCQRYFYRHVLGSWNTNGKSSITDNGSMYNANLCFITIPLPVTMRTAPTLGTSNSSDYYLAYVNGATVTFDTWGLDGVSTKNCLTINATTPSVTAGACALIRTDDAAAYLDAIAEL